MDGLEQLLSLTSSSFGRLPSSSLNNRVISYELNSYFVTFLFSNLQISKYSSTFTNACQRDLKYFGVCLLELILLSKQHYISSNSDSSQRLATAKQLLNNNWHLIPM